MKNINYFIILALLFFLSCNKYGNYSLKKKITIENTIQANSTLDFNSIYLREYLDSNEVSYNFMRFFPNWRVYWDMKSRSYYPNKFVINNLQNYNRFNFSSPQKTYYIFKSENTFIIEYYSLHKLNNVFSYFQINSDSIFIYDNEDYENITGVYVKYQKNVLPLKADW